MVDEVKPWERIKKLFEFPFLLHHMWHGFESPHDLVDFLESGAYEGEVIIDADDVKLLPSPKEKAKIRTRGGKIINASTPVTPPKEVITEQTIEVKPVIDDEIEEIIADDIAQGGNGG